VSPYRPITANSEACTKVRNSRNFCGGLRNPHIFCNRVRIGRSRSSEVDDFGTNRKRVCDFLLVIHSDVGPLLYRFWDIANYWVKIANFSYPSLI